MPGRREKLQTNKIYHVFNKTIDSKPIFTNTQLATLFKETFRYYRSSKASISFSHFRDLENKEFITKYSRTISFRKYFIVDILAFCIMPTHFHLLLKQTQEKGISKYMSDITNSFTRFCNIKHERKGPLFLPPFRARHIGTGNFALHVSRYIHLNPYAGGIVQNLTELEQYKYSSYPEYIMEVKHSLSNPSTIMAIFNNDKKRYKHFVLDRADYQKSLEALKYTEKW